MAVNYPMRYYWTCAESEWATDLMFRDSDQLRRLVPRLMQLGMVSFSSPDVLRFMGKKVSRRSAAISRKLRMLRAHGLIRKRPRSHRYDVSPKGRLILNAILLAHQMTLKQLSAAA